MARADAQSQIMERLLADPAFRARFRRDPVGVAREEGDDALANELASIGDPMQTLDFRESRSSVAGVMMAAAVEGLGIYELGRQAFGHIEEAQAAPVPASSAGAPPAAVEPSGNSAGPALADPANAGAALDDEDSDSDEEDSDEEDSDNEDEDSGESDNWDETHESGSDEDSGGSGDDGDSESGSDEDSGGSGDDGSDSDGDSGSGDGSDGDSAPDDSPPLDDALQVPDAGGYPGNDAAPEKMAAWMASAAQKRGLPPELPVMASLVESGMKNLPGGDADSVGFFQMRGSIWNKGAYSGYPDRPELQLRWFLDHAAAVKKERLARGLPVKDPRHYGEWIADVENPAAQYRGRYQLRWEEAHELLKKAGARRGGDGALDLIDSGGGAHAGRRALTALAAAKKELGTPYRWGGSSPKSGFDCSGLVQWAYAKAGIRIPRVSEQQILAANGTPVSRKHLLPGDLVFFRDSTGDVHHVGMSLGGDKFINAPHTGDVVKIASLKEPYYAQQFTGGRRFDRVVSGVQEARSESGGAHARDAEGAAVRLARAALERDAAEVNHSNSALFRALERQEWGKGKSNEVQFLRAVPAPAQQP